MNFLKRFPFVALVLAAGVLMPEAKTKKSPEKYPDLKKIVVIYKTHFDIGYSDMARNVVHKYRTEMLDHALDNIEKNSRNPRNEQFIWTVPGWPMKQILWEGQEPSRKAAIEGALRSGNLTIHALPYTLYTENNELEELVRGFGYSSSIARQYGLELPRSSKMTDVPSHTWILPTLLKHAGVEFFHFGCNVTNIKPEAPMLFWWEGPDDSRVLTMGSQGYGTDPLPPDDWPYEAWIYINQNGDNEGPPDQATVRSNLDYYREAVPNVEIQIGTLSDFADAILASGAEIPVVRGDMPDSWIHGPLCSPNSVAAARTERPMINAGEALQTIAGSWGVYLPDETATWRKAYDLSLMFGEHTWGYAAQHYRKFPYGEQWFNTYKEGLPEHFKELERSWDEHDNYMYSAAEMIVNPIANEIASLADNVGFDGKRIVVYNPLPWKRSAIVTQNVVYWPTAYGVRAEDNGEVFPVAVHGPSTYNHGNIISFLAKDIPPMGYRTFTTLTEEVSPTGGLGADQPGKTIESPYFKAAFDTDKGAISSLIDKRNGREMVDASAPQGFGQYLYERFGKKEVMRFLNAYLYPQYMDSHGPITDKMDVPDDAVYACATAANTTFTIEEDALKVSAVMTGEIPGPGMPQSVAIRLTLYAEQPYADLSVMIRKSPDGWPEAGWICLPFNVDAPQYRLGRMGSIIDPVTDIIPGSNTRMMWLHNGMNLYNDGWGVGICPIESPLVSLGEPGIQHFDRDYKPSKPYVYVHLYNNKWATNFREWWGGELTSTVRLWAFDNYDAESTLVTPAMEARTSMLVARSSAKPGKLPLTQAGVTISRKGINVTSFGDNPDGEGIVLRLWEQSGNGGQCSITLPAGIEVASVQPVDLRGRASGNPISVSGRTFTVDIGAFEPASFIIEK